MLVILLALCEPCFYFVFEGHAMVYTTASQAGMVVTSAPLAVVVAAWLALGERPHPGYGRASCWPSSASSGSARGPKSQRARPIRSSAIFWEALAMLCEGPFSSYRPAAFFPLFAHLHHHRWWVSSFFCRSSPCP
ncbi:MAG: EamA family transporter [Bilophila sp.]